MRSIFESLGSFSLLFALPRGLSRTAYRMQTNVAFETLTGCGVRFRDKPQLIAKLPDHEQWMTFFEDPEQNTLALMREVR